MDDREDVTRMVQSWEGEQRDERFKAKWKVWRGINSHIKLLSQGRCYGCYTAAAKH